MHLASTFQMIQKQILIAWKNENVFQVTMKKITVSKATLTVTKKNEFNKTSDHTAHASMLIADQDNTSQSPKETQSVQFLPTLDHFLWILRRNKLNWLAFVEELNILLAKEYSSESVIQLLTDFALFLSNSDLTVEEKKLIEESRQAYLEAERVRYNSEDIQSDSDSGAVNPNDWLNITISNLNSEAAKEMIIKQQKIYKQKRKKKLLKQQKMLAYCDDVCQTELQVFFYNTLT